MADIMESETHKEVSCMEARLKEALWQGEEVRWTGRPKPFALLGPDSKTGILVTWVISGLVLAAMIMFLVPQLISGYRTVSECLVMAVVALFVPAILSVRPFLDKKCLERNTLYAVTNYRIIAVVKEDVLYLPISKGLVAAVEHRSGGCGNVCFGKMVGQPLRKSRTLAVLGLHDDDNRFLMEGLMFYHLDRPDQVMEQLIALEHIA